MTPRPALAPLRLTSRAAEVSLHDLARHKPSHLGALPWVTDLAARGDRVDLVVVPTSRDATRVDASGIRLAARLAGAHGCPLLLVVSDDAERDESLERVRGTVAEVTGGRAPVVLRLADMVAPDLGFRTDDSPLREAAAQITKNNAVRAYASDVARKRNNAVLHAREAGYQTLLFVDDDISVWSTEGCGAGFSLDAASLSRAVSAVRSGAHRSVGWVARDFSDNSVVCRLRPLAGLAQGQMIGGGALLLRVDASTPFFPPIYGEDWLHVVADVARHGGRAVARAGKVRQDAPEVAITVERALLEEFGDVLGEGLMNLVGHPDRIFTVGRSRPYWEAVLEHRRVMIDDLRRSLPRRARPDDTSLLDEGRKALDEVAGLHEGAPRELPDMFCDFVDRWQKDLGSWSELLADPASGGLEALMPEVSASSKHRQALTVPA